jgi:hypothetical protein
MATADGKAGIFHPWKCRVIVTEAKLGKKVKNSNKNRPKQQKMSFWQENRKCQEIRKEPGGGCCEKAGKGGKQRNKRVAGGRGGG